METEIRALERCTIEEFADKHGLKMVIEERSKSDWCRADNFKQFYAHFDGCSLAERGMQIGMFGDGNTHEEAIANYAEEISGKTLIIGCALKGKRVSVPIILVNPHPQER